jgi:hypothetical protein
MYRLKMTMDLGKANELLVLKERSEEPIQLLRMTELDAAIRMS